jgi:hypothetical protein
MVKLRAAPSSGGKVTCHDVLFRKGKVVSRRVVSSRGKVASFVVA